MIPHFQQKRATACSRSSVRPIFPLVQRACQIGWIAMSSAQTFLLSGLAFQPSFASVWEETIWNEILSSLALTIHTLHQPPGRAMTSSYMAFSPTCYTPPSLSGFKPIGRDKLGLHGIFQQSQQRQLHSLSAADAAHADFPCFTSKLVEHSRYLLPRLKSCLKSHLHRTLQLRKSPPCLLGRCGV
jgi:hypothetical protein